MWPFRWCAATVPPCGRLCTRPGRTMRNYLPKGLRDPPHQVWVRGQFKQSNIFPLTVCLTHRLVVSPHQAQNMQNTGKHLAVAHAVSLSQPPLSKSISGKVPYETSCLHPQKASQLREWAFGFQALWYRTCFRYVFCKIHHFNTHFSTCFTSSCWDQGFLAMAQRQYPIIRTIVQSVSR